MISWSVRVSSLQINLVLRLPLILEKNYRLTQVLILCLVAGWILVKNTFKRIKPVPLSWTGPRSGTVSLIGLATKNSSIWLSVVLVVADLAVVAASKVVVMAKQKPIVATMCPVAGFGYKW